MSTLNYSLSQLNDPKTCTHIQFPIKHDTVGGKIGLIQDIDFGVMEGFGYSADGYGESSRIDNFVSFVTTIDLLFKNLNTRINDLKSTVDKLASTSFIASITTTPKAKQSLTYKGTSQDLITAGSASNGVMYYSLTNEGQYSPSVPQGTNAGTYTVFYYAKGNTGYKDSATSQLNVTIAKASSLKTPPTLKFTEKPHDGSPHDLINAGVANNGTMEYGFNFNGSSNTLPTSWSSNIPQGTDSGTYHIWYRIQNGVDSTNYELKNATYIGSVTIVVSTISVTNITLNKPSLSINANGTDTITATVSPSDATNKTINWSSSDDKIATVTASTSSGQAATVTWKKAGTCIITATSEGNLSISKTCSVTCQDAPNNCYIGNTAQEEFTLDDLDRYVDEKPSELMLPGGTHPNAAVWIYPASWGQPTSAIDVESKAEQIQTFNYADLTLPEGYTGCWVELYSDTTYTLKW